MSTALCGFLLAVAAVVALVAVQAPRADAAIYKMVACAANNGSAPFSVATNTTSAKNPGGIFDFNNWCGGAGGDPPGEAAYVRINEHEAGGEAGTGAYGSMTFSTPGWVHFLAAGGYTREPNAFNAGWRARFWSPDANVEFMLQGVGAPVPTSNTFGPHLWPFGNYIGFRTFIFELLCVRSPGCDRTNYNAVDANGFVFILEDESNAGAGFTDPGSAFLQGQWVTGGQNINFAVSDAGSGIRWERARIDGAQIWGWDHGPECNVTFSQTNGEWARAYQPCPTGGPYGRTVGLNTATLADGAHTVQVCAQDYAQYQGLNGTGSESCDARTIRTDNSAPGAPSGLFVNSANPQRYMDHFSAQFSLPPNQGSPISTVHYNVINAADEVVQAERTLKGTDPTAIADIEGPKQAGNYRLRVWLQDQVGLTGPASTAPVPRDTTPPGAPQSVAVAAPTSSRSSDGFDVSWRNIVDAGSPIEAAHYQVLNAGGGVVVPTQTVNADNVQSIQNLETPNDRGSFSLRLWLEDGEGNTGAPVSVPLSYSCVKSPVTDGQQLTAAFSDAGDKTVEQGEGATISGELRGAGGDVAGAPVCVFSNVVTDSDPQFLGIAITGSNGAYRFAITPGASRKVTALYRPGSRELSASSTLQTRVHPTLTTPSQVVRNKHVAHFEGDIPGPHNNQVVIVLQVKSGKGWLAFRRYRTRNDGHFELEYKFQRTTQPTSYEMRAQVRETTGYPYLQGDSDPLMLRVVPGKETPAGAKRAKRCAKGKRAVKKHGKARCLKKKTKKHKSKAKKHKSAGHVAGG